MSERDAESFLYSLGNEKAVACGSLMVVRDLF